MLKMKLFECPCCMNSLRCGWTEWHLLCERCGYEGSLLQPQINGPTTSLDEDKRRKALETLRHSNFQSLLNQIDKFRRPNQHTLLDVGSAHGWFIDACAHASPKWQAQGLEPDSVIAASALARGVPVREGFFPHALEPEEQFDAICFNDVFEHLADPAATLRAVRRHLQPDGLLVLNLPSSEGIFYRSAKVAARFGGAMMQGPWRRMWQEGMPSPHLHYFNARNLSALLHASGFEVLHTGQLPSIRREGLLARLRFDRRSAWMAPLLGPLLWLAVPAIHHLSPDIRVLIARPTLIDKSRP